MIQHEYLHYFAESFSLGTNDEKKISETIFLFLLCTQAKKTGTADLWLWQTDYEK